MTAADLLTLHAGHCPACDGIPVRCGHAAPYGARRDYGPAPTGVRAILVGLSVTVPFWTALALLLIAR